MWNWFLSKEIKLSFRSKLWTIVVVLFTNYKWEFLCVFISLHFGHKHSKFLEWINLFELLNLGFVIDFSNDIEVVCVMHFSFPCHWQLMDNVEQMSAWCSEKAWYMRKKQRFSAAPMKPQTFGISLQKKILTMIYK